MPEERDLEWVEPRVIDNLQAWNEKHGDTACLRPATLREFFRAVDTSRCPIYRGEAPYAFYSIPAFEPQTYQQCRLAENVLVAAEKFAVLRDLEGLGRIPGERLEMAWEHLFWPQDHNIAGNEGSVNDAVRTHHAVHARVIGESVLREIEASFLTHATMDEMLGRAFLVLNPLSWRFSDVVEVSVELPGNTGQAVEVVDGDGRPVPSQVLQIERADADRIDFQLDDPDQAKTRATLALLARNVPATGYKAFYVRPAASESGPASRAVASSGRLETDYWRVDIDAGRLESLWCKRMRRQIAAQGQTGFLSLVALEDLRGNLEDGYDPWDPRENPPNYTGREWTAWIDPESMEIVENGPARLRLRALGELLGCPVEQEVILLPELPKIGLRVAIHWSGIKNRQVRLRLPFNLTDPTVTYETPYGSVVFGRDEMPNTYRGDGTRWVQKWIDLSEPEFGITLSAGCCAVNLNGATVSPLLVSTTYCRGDAYYWTFNRGRHEFTFWLHTHNGDQHLSRAYGIGWEAWNPLRVVRGQPRIVSVPHRRCLPASREYLRCEHPGVVVTVLKSALDGSADRVLRAFNVTDRPVSAAIHCPRPVELAAACDLNESPTGPARWTQTVLHAELAPHQIGCWRVRFQ